MFSFRKVTGSAPVPTQIPRSTRGQRPCLDTVFHTVSTTALEGWLAVYWPDSQRDRPVSEPCRLIADPCGYLRGIGDDGTHGSQSDHLLSVELFSRLGADTAVRLGVSFVEAAQPGRRRIGVHYKGRVDDLNRSLARLGLNLEVIVGQRAGRQ